MIHRLTQLYESVGLRDLVQIGILALVIYGVLRFLGRACGVNSSISRGLSFVAIGFFLLAQVVVAALDFTELSAVFDFLLTSVLIGLLVIFQPELRRGLMVLGQSTVWRYFGPQRGVMPDRLADAATLLAKDGVGALIVVQREQNLASFAENGEPIDSVISTRLLRCLFTNKSPLHDGAVIVANNRIAAAGCQLPLTLRDGRGDDSPSTHLGMRHRAALCMSEETDALVVVVSEETGRISLAYDGTLEPLPREKLTDRIATLLSAPKEETRKAA